MEHEYASKGVAGSGLGLGVAGTALGLLNGGWGMARTAAATGGESTPVNRYEVTLMQEIASRDATIALKDAIADTDKKMVEVYTVLDRRDRELRDIITAMKEAQNGVNLQQAVYNGTNTATLGGLQAQIAALQNLTKTVIPADSVCPEYMPRYNSWTAPTTTASGS